MSTNKGSQDPFRELLGRRAAELRKKVLESGGEVSRDEVAELESLARLSEIGSSEPAVPTRKRWPVILALVLTLMIVSLLLFLDVPQTEFELDLEVSEVAFVITKRQVLSDVMQLTELSVAGLQQVNLPRSRLLEHEDEGQGRLPAQSFSAADSAGAKVRFSRAAGTGGSVTLQALDLPEGTQVRLALSDVSGRYRLSLEGEGLEFEVSLAGPVRIDLSGHAGAENPDQPAPKIGQNRDFGGAGRQAVLRPGAAQVDLDFSLTPSEQGRFEPLLSASGLVLARIDEFSGADGTIVRRQSTVLSGTLYLESLNGRERKLRPSEQLRFERSAGVIRRLDLGEKSIAIRFSGCVSGMTTGSESAPRSLMPSWLEWLRERQAWALLWGTAFYLFGLFQAVSQWWRKSQ